MSTALCGGEVVRLFSRKFWTIFQWVWWVNESGESKFTKLSSKSPKKRESIIIHRAHHPTIQSPLVYHLGCHLSCQLSIILITDRLNQPVRPTFSTRPAMATFVEALYQRYSESMCEDSSIELFIVGGFSPGKSGEDQCCSSFPIIFKRKVLNGSQLNFTVQSLHLNPLSMYG